jgi:hypothetical protein
MTSPATNCIVPVLGLDPETCRSAVTPPQSSGTGKCHHYLVMAPALSSCERKPSVGEVVARIPTSPHLLVRSEDT